MPPFEPEGAGQETSRPLLRRLRALHQQVASRPVGVQLLGYDVSHPLPSFHSFLFQPGLREEPEAPDLDINIAGLLDSIQQVEQILPVANSMASSWRPFCGIGVYFVA